MKFRKDGGWAENLGDDGADGSLEPGGANIAVGRSAMASNTSGDYNVAIGFAVATSLTTGGHNTAIGYNAL